MTQEQRAEINRQNAQHSTGPKTPEGKARSAQNSVSHGLSSAKPPLQNPDFIQLHNEFIQERNPQTPSQRLWVLELAHIAWKLKQIPSYEYEIELNSPLTPAEQFAQDKPAPLPRLWNLHLRLLARFNSLDRKLNAHPILQNEPNVDQPPSVDEFLQNEPSKAGVPKSQRTPQTYSAPAQPMNSPAQLVQNEPTPDSLLQSMREMLQNNPGLADGILQSESLPEDLRQTLNSILQNEPTQLAAHSVPIRPEIPFNHCPASG